jgi:hypothetical protein
LRATGDWKCGQSTKMPSKTPIETNSVNPFSVLPPRQMKLIASPGTDSAPYIINLLRAVKSDAAREAPRGRARARKRCRSADGAAAVFKPVSDYWFGTSSTRRFWARLILLLVATKFVLPYPCGLMRPSATLCLPGTSPRFGSPSENHRLYRTDDRVAVAIDGDRHVRMQLGFPQPRRARLHPPDGYLTCQS